MAGLSVSAKDSQASSKSNIRSSWISTRKGAIVTGVLASYFAKSYLLHSVMQAQAFPLNELSQDNVTFIEAPPTTVPRYDEDFLGLVNKVKDAGSEVICFIQPSLRKKTQRCRWVDKWNQGTKSPFRFYETCSCICGDGSPGCHYRLYIGTSTSLPSYPSCNEVPTLGGSDESRNDAFIAGVKQVYLNFTSLDHITALRQPCTDVQDLAEVQRAPDSLNQHPLTNHLRAFPTDAKEKEKERKRLAKEAGQEIVVKKKVKIVEDHWDDCGEDLSSITDIHVDSQGFVMPCDFDSEEENECAVVTAQGKAYFAGMSLEALEPWVSMGCDKLFATDVAVGPGEESGPAITPEPSSPAPAAKRKPGRPRGSGAKAKAKAEAAPSSPAPAAPGPRALPPTGVPQPGRDPRAPERHLSTCPGC